MTREERENALHCLRVMIDEEVCEECNLYGTTGTDHCEADCVRAVIETLEQEPCNDCISRKEALKGVDMLCLETSYDNEKVADMIRDLPPVSPKQDWIPVAERLPEDEEDVLFQYEKTITMGYHQHDTFPNINTDMDETGWYDEQDNFICETFDAIAWQPLPEPYKENKDESDN